jgi:hypothetical protein
MFRNLCKIILKDLFWTVWAFLYITGWFTPQDSSAKNLRQSYRYKVENRYFLADKTKAFDKSGTKTVSSECKTDSQCIAYRDILFHSVKTIVRKKFFFKKFCFVEA